MTAKKNTAINREHWPNKNPLLHLT